MPGFKVPVPARRAGTPDSAKGGYDPQNLDIDTAPSNTIETVRKNRFEVLIYPNDSQLKADDKTTSIKTITLYPITCTTPSITYDEIVIHNGQDRIYKPGKPDLNTIEVSFYDVVESSNPTGLSKGSISQRLRTILPNHNRYSKFDSNILFTMKIFLLDGQGRVINWHTLEECYIKDYKTSDLDMGASDICNVTISVRYNRFLTEE